MNAGERKRRGRLRGEFRHRDGARPVHVYFEGARVAVAVAEGEAARIAVRKGERQRTFRAHDGVVAHGERIARKEQRAAEAHEARTGRRGGIVAAGIFADHIGLQREDDLHLAARPVALVHGVGDSQRAVSCGDFPAHAAAVGIGQQEANAHAPLFALQVRDLQRLAGAHRAEAARKDREVIDGQRTRTLQKRIAQGHFGVRIVRAHGGQDHPGGLREVMPRRRSFVHEQVGSRYARIDVAGAEDVHLDRVAMVTPQVEIRGGVAAQKDVVVQRAASVARFDMHERRPFGCAGEVPLGLRADGGILAPEVLVEVVAPLEAALSGKRKPAVGRKQVLDVGPVLPEGCHTSGHVAQRNAVQGEPCRTALCERDAQIETHGAAFQRHGNILVGIDMQILAGRHDQRVAGRQVGLARDIEAVGFQFVERHFSGIRSGIGEDQQVVVAVDQTQGNRTGGVRDVETLRGFGHTPVEQVQAQVAHGSFLRVVECPVEGFAADGFGVQREGDLRLAGLILRRRFVRTAQAAAQRERNRQQRKKAV